MNPISSDTPTRRNFLQRMIAAPAIGIGALSASATAAPATDNKPWLKLSLNAYSFNKPLLDGTMTLDDLLEFAAEVGLHAVDITGYYFKGYPKVPGDEMIYQVKRKAFALGLEICGTGVRNDFTHADAAKRRASVELVKAWTDVSQKLGGQTIRIFSGTQKPAGYTHRQIFDWMVADIRECVDYAQQRGIVVALQNHDDFIKTADDTIEIMEAIHSPWYGLMLDIGSFRTGDPYEQIARTIRYAVTWQVKEKVFYDGKEVEVDAARLAALMRSAGFRGYLPLETLGEGDPKVKVRALVERFRGVLGG